MQYLVQTYLVRGLFLLSLLPLWTNAQPDANCGLVVNAGPDKKVCSDNPTTFLEGTVSGSGLRGFEWMPPDGLSNPKLLRPVVTVSGPQCYILTGKKKSDVNLVVNGNFEMGATGFSSDHSNGVTGCPAGPLLCEGMYFVTNNPQSGHPGFAPCGDHTSGGGNMMAVNAATFVSNVWCQAVPVKPDHDYCFSAWATTLVSASPAQLEVSINGTIVTGLGLGAATCLWEEMQGDWNSGGSAIASICITNLNPAASGNDFAIDDIVLNEVCEQYDTVCVDLVEVLAVAQDPPRICCNNPVVTLDGSGSSVGPGYSYCWVATQGGRIVSGENTLNPIVDRPGIYTLMVKGPEGCTEEVEIEVEGNLIPPRVIAESPDSLDCTNPEVRLIGGASPDNNAEFEWAGPNGFFSFDQSPNVTEPGVYTLTVTDDCGCVGTAMVTVFGKANLLTIETQTDTIDCNSSEVWLIAKANRTPTAFEWNGPNGYNCQLDSCMTSDTGWYFLTSTTPDGCSKLDSIYVVGDLDPPLFTSTNDTINCISPIATISGSSPENLNYLWKNNGNNVGNDSIFTTPDGGTYTLVVEGQNGCTDSIDLFVLTDTIRPNFTLSGLPIDCDSVKTGICHDFASSDFTWTWNSGSNSSDVCFDVTEEGWYVLTANNPNGCAREDSIFIDKKDSRPDPDFLDGLINCNQASDTFISGLAGTNILWTTPSGQNRNGDSLIVDEGGWYIFEMTAQGFECPIKDSVFLNTDFQKPSLTLTADSLTCLKDSTIIQYISPDAIQSFEWTGPNNFSRTTAEPVVRDPGIYQVVVRLANGCSDTFDIEIFQSNDFPIVGLQADTITCRNPSINIIATSDQPGMAYEWTSPSGQQGTDSTFTTNEGGEFMLTIRNSQGCTIEKTIEVTIDQQAPEIDLSEADTLTCDQQLIELNLQLLTGNTDSIIWKQNGLEAFGGNSWNTSNSGEVIVQVIGQNGCITLDTVEVIQDTVAPVLSVIGDTINCDLPMVNLMASSLRNDEIIWINPQGDSITNSSLTTELGGIFSVVATGENGCQSFSDYEVIVDTLAPLLSPTNDTLTCIKTSVFLESNTNADQINWLFPDQSNSAMEDINTNIPGVYHLTAKNNNGCIASDSVAVAIDTSRAQLTTFGGDMTCDSPRVIIGFNSDIPGSFIWRNEAGMDISNLPSPSVNEAGTFTIFYTADNSGCISQADIIVEDLRDLPIPILNLDHPNCDSDLGEISIQNITGGSGPYEIYIDDNLVATNRLRQTLTPGKHALRIIDMNGCASEDTVQVNPIIRLTSDLETEIEIDLGDTARVTINNNPSSNLVQSVNWTPKELVGCDTCLTTDLFPSQNTRFSVLVVDTNGCEQILTILIKVNQPRVYVPNVFSPQNGDQVNDKFFPFARIPDQVTIDQMVLYSRWGERLFLQNDFPPNSSEYGWDGTFNGQPMLPGVVVYHITGRYGNGEAFQLAGDLTILD